MTSFGAFRERSPESASSTQNSAAVQVPVGALTSGPVVRQGPIDGEYLDLLVRTEGRWPAILVRRTDHRVIDGWYRVLAARELGHQNIWCDYFDGDDEAAFLESVRVNTSHGLPLTLKERKAAAIEVLVRRSDWSNRRVAEHCGLSADTIAGLRHEAEQRRPSADIRTLDVREGRDGRKRPVDRQAMRQRIEAALQERPDASLRQIARLVGSSPETVRSVRRSRMAEHVDRTPPEPGRPATISVPQAAPLRLGSAYTATDEGTRFADWFERTAIDDAAVDLCDSVPLSRVYEISDEARRRSERWHRFAQAVESRARNSTRSPR